MYSPQQKKTPLYYIFSVFYIDIHTIVYIYIYIVSQPCVKILQPALRKTLDFQILSVVVDPPSKGILSLNRQVFF